jgi:hypothetical protein
MARRHLLSPDDRVDDTTAVVRALIALHATDPATVYLSVASRRREPSLDATDAAVLRSRSVVRQHAMRRTVWVMEPATATAAYSACTGQLARREWELFARLLADNGVAQPAEWIEQSKREAMRIIDELGTATARQVVAKAPHLNVPLQMAVGKQYAGVQGAHTRLVQNLGFDATIVRTSSTGSWVSGEFVWSTTMNWLGREIVDPHLSVRDASAALAILYLRAFGPVTTADLQWWAGWSGAQTKQAIADIEAIPVTTDLDQTGTKGDAWVLADDIDPASPIGPWATILPSLDPTVMGWKQRDWYTGSHGAFGFDVFDRNGNAGNAIVADGAVVGTWAHKTDGTVVTHLFEKLSRDHQRQIDLSIERYRATVGDTIVKPRYPAPLQAALLAAS